MTSLIFHKNIPKRVWKNKYKNAQIRNLNKNLVSYIEIIEAQIGLWTVNTAESYPTEQKLLPY